MCDNTTNGTVKDISIFLSAESKIRRSIAKNTITDLHSEAFDALCSILETLKKIHMYLNKIEPIPKNTSSTLSYLQKALLYINSIETIVDGAFFTHNGCYVPDSNVTLIAKTAKPKHAHSVSFVNNEFCDPSSVATFDPSVVNLEILHLRELKARIELILSSPDKKCCLKDDCDCDDEASCASRSSSHSSARTNSHSNSLSSYIDTEHDNNSDCPSEKKSSEKHSDKHSDKKSDGSSGSNKKKIDDILNKIVDVKGDQDADDYQSDDAEDLDMEDDQDVEDGFDGDMTSVSKNQAKKLAKNIVDSVVKNYNQNASASNSSDKSVFQKQSENSSKSSKSSRGSDSVSSASSRYNRPIMCQMSLLRMFNEKLPEYRCNVKNAMYYIAMRCEEHQCQKDILSIRN